MKQNRILSTLMLSALGAGTLLGTSDAQAMDLQPNGDLKLTVNLQFPPTQEKLDLLEQQMQNVQRQFCDVTDTAVRLTDVDVVVGDNTDGKSDIWWFLSGGKNGRAYKGGSKIVLFGDGSLRADVISHELGHLILGLGEGYSEQQRSGGCGIGPNIDAALLSPERNTVMQQAQAQQCRDAAGKTPRDYDSRLAAPACLSDADCAKYSSTWGTFDTCAYPDLSSELTTRLNRDPLMGSGVAQCPAAFEGRVFNMSASLWERRGFGNELFPTLNCAGSPTPTRAATCPDGTAPVVDGLDLTTLETANATSDHALQGSQDVIDSVGHVTGNFSQREGDSFHRVRYFMRYYGQNPTTGANIWTLALAADAADFGGAEGDIVELGRFNLEFDSASQQLSAINQRVVDAQGRDRITQRYASVILGGTDANVYGAPTTDADGRVIQGQLQGTGAFVQGSNSGVVAPEVELELHLTGIEDKPLSAEAGGAYYSRFNYGAEHTRIWHAAGVAQRGVCAETDWCQASWNAQTTNFEAAHQSLDYLRNGQRVLSDWEDARNVLVNKWKLNAFLAPDNVTPATPTEADCGGPLKFNVGDFTVPDQVMIVLDRSGSMSADANVTIAADETRLEYAQAAARAYVRLAARCTPVPPATTCTGSVSTGLVSFSDDAAVDIDLTSVGTNPGDAPIADFDAAIDGLAAGGHTAIGTALRVAGERIDAGSGSVKAVLLMSDGENNRPKDGSDDPTTIARQLEERGIQVFPMPVGSVGDRSLFEKIAEVTGGQMLDAPSAYELPQVFFEAFARTRGEALSVIRTPIEIKKDVYIGRIEPGLLERAVDWAEGVFNPTAHAQSLPESQTIPFYVEHGGDRLNLLLSVREMPSASWKPEYALVDPNGQVVLRQSSASVVNDAFFHLMQVDHPVEGEWSLVVSGEAGSGIQRSYLAVHVENPGPECFADAVVTKDQDAVTITASAAFDGGIESGVSYSGWVKRPDGSYGQLAFEPETAGTGAVATLAGADLPYRGTYNVSVRCDVVDGAKEHPGESIFRDLAADPEDLSVDPFQRAVSADFMIATGSHPPQCQPETDTDGDGLPDVCDDDADADDIPNADDPDPLNADNGLGLGLPGGCLSNPSSACCSTDQTLVEGTDSANAIVPRASKGYCVLAKGGQDQVITPGKSDTIFGGSGADYIVSNGGADVIVGGDGADFINGGMNGSLAVDGGAGADHINAQWSTEPAILIGGAGADYIMGGYGNDTIRPGAGADYVNASDGDDTVIVHAACELEAGMFLYGGMGNDTLILPIPLADAQALGVSVVSFENIVIDPTLSKLAECK